MAKLPERSDWVSAAPFRAHIRHLHAATGLPWVVLARAAGVSPRLVHHLVNGRAGRLPRRITHESAHRLLSLDRQMLAQLRLDYVPASLTSRQLRRLLASGTDPRQLAAWCGLTVDELLALVNAATVSRLIAMLVDAACPPSFSSLADETVPAAA